MLFAIADTCPLATETFQRGAPVVALRADTVSFVEPRYNVPFATIGEPLKSPLAVLHTVLPVVASKEPSLSTFEILSVITYYKSETSLLVREVLSLSILYFYDRV